MTNTMQDLLTTAEHAAKQSDRALLIAILLLGGIAWITVSRWFISDRKALADRLTAITDRHIEQTEKLAVVVASCEQAMNNNSNALREMKDVMRGCSNNRA